MIEGVAASNNSYLSYLERGPQLEIVEDTALSIPSYGELMEVPFEIKTWTGRCVQSTMLY